LYCLADYKIIATDSISVITFDRGDINLTVDKKFSTDVRWLAQIQQHYDDLLVTENYDTSTTTTTIVDASKTLLA
jgi:hypothetical protein